MAWSTSGDLILLNLGGRENLSCLPGMTYPAIANGSGGDVAVVGRSTMHARVDCKLFELQYRPRLDTAFVLDEVRQPSYMISLHMLGDHATYFLILSSLHS